MPVYLRFVNRSLHLALELAGYSYLTAGNIGSFLARPGTICMAGAVCGDHCSPISDTTIMASAGAHCSHVNHVSTQLPYAITAASCSAACYVITGLTQMFLGSSASLWTSLILLGVAIVLELVVLNILRVKLGKKTKA